jgi:hypothetical protein
MKNENTRMQFLAGLITESQFRRINETLNGDETNLSESSEEKQLRKKGGELYEYVLMHSRLSGDDYLDTILKKSIPNDILVKISKGNGGSLGNGMHEIIKSKFLPSKYLKEIIIKLEDASDILKKSQDEVDFYYYGWDKIKNKWYDSRNKGKGKLKEWGGGISDPNDVRKYSKEREWEERQKTPTSSRGKLMAGDIIKYDGKKWMILFIHPDGNLDLKMQKPYRDEIPNLKIGDPRIYIEYIPQSKIK